MTHKLLQMTIIKQILIRLELCESQKQGDFVSGISWMLRRLSVLPKVLKIANLKSGVIKAERYELDFNELLM